MANTSESGARFRRVGFVTAARLEADLTWHTAHGDELRGEVGDWVVESADGGQRTVKDQEFGLLYEAVDDRTYRRTGTVTARQVRDPEAIETLEGTATAHVGDWVVTADDGDRWPVPDAVFRASYEPI